MLRAKHFKFVSYKVEPAKGRVYFRYEIGFYGKRTPLKFVEALEFPRGFDKADVPKALLENLFANLHLALGISYYKLYCPPKLILPYRLDGRQAEFWRALYKNGLGEFFYRNKLDPQILPKFSSVSKSQFAPVWLKRRDRSLVGIGGGKDSLAVAILMREQDFDFTGFVMETQAASPLVDSVVKQLGVGALKVRRILDRKLFQNHPDSYNGHIPISAIIAFVGLAAGAIYDYRHVVVSNEHSSNFGNVRYRGMEINHQWSKSAEFEAMFQDYVRSYVTPDVGYFSALRPYYEIRVVETVSRHPEYFNVFSSCNRNFRIHDPQSDRLWCGECAKCVYVFLLFAAFLSKKDLLAMFGKNLFADMSLLPLFMDVLGWGAMKPFDCVGTFEEAQAALYLASKRFADEPIVKALPVTSIKQPEDLVRKVMGAYASEAAMPVPFKFLAAKKALILGYDKEGKQTGKFLKKNYPKLEIGIADQKQGKDYLDRQCDYDLGLRTPGLAKGKLSMPYTTATNIFFSRTEGNLKIGVTGTKGKSTTASLICHILNSAGKKARLLGNIGHPMLEALPLAKGEIAVLELSSYQLDDIEYSPDIAVALNLYSDHMDYHGGVESYHQAKRNLVKCQRPENLFIYNSKVPQLRRWARESVAQTRAFDREQFICSSGLTGEHNKSNVLAAVAVARSLGISDAKIAKAVASFKPLPHRLELVGEFRGVKFYDDAISTTPESTIAAIRSLKNIGTIFLGGTDRGYDFSELEKAVRAAKIRNVALFPDSGRRMFKGEKKLSILYAESMAEAVKFAYANTRSGEICLLSTASPSYSLWKNFEEKGDEFRKLAKKFRGPAK